MAAIMPVAQGQHLIGPVARIVWGKPVLIEVTRTGEAHRGKMKRTLANVQLIESFGGMLPTEVVALPIMHGGRAIGILYGDNAEHRAP